MPASVPKKLISQYHYEVMSLRNDIVSFWFWGYRGEIKTELQSPLMLHMYLDVIKQSKKEGKDHESIQSSTTPDPGYQW